jgi:hypothetical protein
VFNRWVSGVSGARSRRRPASVRVSGERWARRGLAHGRQSAGVQSRLLPAPEARQVGDPELRAFAERLDEGARIADLREARIGSGFVWGRDGPQTQVQRAGSRLLVAITPPEWAPGAQRGLVGFFAWLLGR